MTDTPKNPVLAALRHVGRFIVGIFVVVMAGYGLSSVLKARKISKS